MMGPKRFMMQGRLERLPYMDARSFSSRGPNPFHIRGELLHQVAIDLVHAVPDAFENGNVVVEHRPQRRQRMPAATQFAFVVAIRLEPRDLNEIARGEMRE